MIIISGIDIQSNNRNDLNTDVKSDIRNYYNTRNKISRQK